MKRAFADQSEFDAWHANAKAALGLPVVGVNAATGLPAPGKQATVDLTALGFDDEGNQLLEAVITDDTLVARGFQDELIRADLLTAAEIAVLASSYPAWATATSYATDDLRSYAGTLWLCVQAHTSQPDWTPDVVPALWTPAAPAGVIPVWVQPTGAQDAYNTGDQVVFEGQVYESLIDANVWSPTAYPAGWQLVP